MSNGNLNQITVNPLAGQNPLPKGDYNVTVIGANHWIHPTANYDVVKITFEVLDGPEKGTVCEKYYQLNSDPSFNFCRGELKRIGFPFSDFEELEDALSKLPGMALAISVRDNGSGTVIYIKGLYKPVKNTVKFDRDALWKAFTERVDSK